MIIPTLVLVSAMQFGDPQSGARIDDLSHSPWRETPTVKMVSYPAAAPAPAKSSNPQTNGPQNGPVGPVASPLVQPPVSPIPYSSPAGFSLGVSDPDLAGGNPLSTPFPGPPGQDYGTAVPPPSYQPPSLLNGTSQSGYPPSTYPPPTYSSSSYPATPSRTEYGTTRIENNKVHLSRAQVKFDKIAKLGAPVGGIIVEQRTVKCDAEGNVLRGSSGDPIMIDLQRGVQLFVGQQVAQIDDRYPQEQYRVAVTKLDVAEKEAAQTIGIDYAQAALNTAESDYRRSLDINKSSPGVVPAAELELKRFKVIEAQLQKKKAISDHENQQESVKIQEAEVKVAKTQLDLRKVKTPFDAVVVNVLSEVGNYLREGEPIAEVAKLDKLKVIASVDGKKVTQEQIDGKRVTVTVTEAPGGTNDQFEGFVRYAAPIFRDSQRTFEVEIEVDNRFVNGHWLLKEGDFVEVVIHL